MDNSDFWASVDAIIKEDFMPEGLAKLERYAELFISGQLLYKRFSPHEQHGCAAGGASNVIASLLAGAETGTNQDAESLGGFQREFQCETAQAERIERWAKAVGIWIVCHRLRLRINTPELHQGGIRQLSKEVWL